MLNYKNDFSQFGLLMNSPIKINYKNSHILIKVPTIKDTKSNNNITKALSFIITEIDEFHSHAEQSGIKANTLIDYINGMVLFQDNEFKTALIEFFGEFIENCTLTKQGFVVNEIPIDNLLMEDFRFYFAVGCGISTIYNAEQYHAYACNQKQEGELTEAQKLKKKIMEKQAKNRQMINKIKSKRNNDGNSSIENLVFLLAFRIKFYSFDELVNKNMYTINYMSDLLAESQGGKKKSSSNPFEHLKR